jgi:hypothetical protein
MWLRLFLQFHVEKIHIVSIVFNSYLFRSIQNSLILSMVLFWYWPVKSGLIGRKQFRNSKKMRTAVRALTKNIIDKHFETYEEGVSRDFIDIYISQIKQSEPGSSFPSEEGSRVERGKWLVGRSHWENGKFPFSQ